MKKIWKTIIIIFIAVNIYSLIPVISLYLKKMPSGTYRNSDVATRLEKNKGSYFSFIVISDTGSGLFLNESATLKIVSRINREDRFQKGPIDFIVNVGDVTFRGRPSHFENYLKIKDMLKFSVIDAMGNHDDDFDDNCKEKLFDKYCGTREFSFTDRNSYFIVLDDSNGDFTEEQFASFEKELVKGKTYEHIFVFMHKPPFNPFTETWYRVENNPWSLKFMRLCDKYGVDIVFAGHEEGQRVAQFGSVKYIVTGGAGTMMMRPSSDGGFLNYVVVKVNGEYADYEVKKVNPPVWEFFGYYMWKDLVFFLTSWLN